MALSSGKPRIKEIGGLSEKGRLFYCEHLIAISFLSGTHGGHQREKSRYGKFAGDLANTQDALNYCVAEADRVSRSQVALQQVKQNSCEIAKKGELGSAVTKAVFDLIAQN